MTNDLTGGDLRGGVERVDRLMDETRRLLASMRADQARPATNADASGDPAGEVVGAGADPEGQARATVSAGRVRSLEIDPRLLRHGREAGPPAE